MTTRTAKRRRARDRRLKRGDLVHAAGCVFQGCLVRFGVFHDHSFANEAMAEGIRLPRSVARKWLGSGGAM
jgi:hypothetical protein